MTWEQLTLFDVEEPVTTPPWQGLPANWDAVETAETFRDMLKYSWELSPTQKSIIVYGLMLTDLLYRKNLRYGNSALAPVEVFAKDLTPQQRMAVRMDDKINRITLGTNTTSDGEDPRIDLAGYLLLSLIADNESTS